MHSRWVLWLDGEESCISGLRRGYMLHKEKLHLLIHSLNISDLCLHAHFRRWQPVLKQILH